MCPEPAAGVQPSALAVLQGQKRPIAVFLAVLATLALAGEQGWAQREDPEALFARAVRLHQSGDIEGAIKAYEAFLEMRPERVDARSNLGAAYARMGRYEDAIKQYKRALLLDSRNPAIHYNLGLAHYKASQIPEAAAELAAAASAQPDNLNALVLLADCHLRMGENKKVIELLSAFESTHKEDRAILYLLGTALIRDKQVERGQVLVDRILRDGDSAEARLMLGTACLLGHDYAGALREFERAVKLNPKLPAAYSFYGRALMATGSHDQALEAFRRELELNPTDYPSNFYVGVLLKQEQKFDEALDYLRRALQLQPGTADVRYQIGSLHVSTGNLAEAQRVLEDLVKDAPEFVEAHVSLATVYYRLKRKQEGDREREIIQKLNAAIQTRAPGAREGMGPAYRGEGLVELHPDGKSPQ